MIKTKHDISISIDDKTFKITAHEITSKQQKQLEEQLSKHAEAIKKIQKQSTKLSRLNERYSMLKEDRDTQEALEVLTQIEKLEDEIDELIPSLKKANNEIENLLEERLMMLIDGDDKDELFECVKEKGITNKVIFDEIAKSIQDSKEKK